MANLLKGEVAFVEGGKRYILCLNHNALCELEVALAMEGGDFSAAFRGPSAIRQVFKIGLAEHHPEMTDKDVGLLLTELGRDRPALLAFEALKWAMPDAEEANAPVDPPQANRKTRRAAGTGKV
jgi:hypothetical protein